MPTVSERLMRRVQHMVGVGRTKTPVDDTGAAQTVQLETLSGMHVDKVPVAALFGLSSVMPIGSDVTFLAIAGDSSAMVAVTTGHQDSRPRGTPAGGTVLYDQGGSLIVLNNDGSIRIFGSKGSTILLSTDGSISVTPQNGIVTLNGTLRTTGDVIMGFGTAGQISGLDHTHTSEGVGSPTSPPNPGT